MRGVATAASALAVAAALLHSATPAVAEACFLRVSPTVVTPDASVRVVGKGCRSGDEVFIISRVHRERLRGFGGATARTTRTRTFAASERVRAKARGIYHVTVRCGGGNLGVSARLRVR
jgi:hypothetical protein